jgi:xanthine dehydrogenase/oxidase
MMITEMMMSEVADRLGIDQIDIRRLNMYKENDKTHFDMLIEDWFLPEMFESMISECNFIERRNEIREFNSRNEWKKRGIAITPTKFSVGFEAKFMNQGGALVHIFIDGSVLLHFGGVEMGQGLFTKMIQIAADTLKITDDRIYVAETSTNTVVNSQPTAGSSSTDLYGPAIEEACEILYKRISPYRLENPSGTMKDWATAAYFDRVSLSSNGFYITPDLDYDEHTNKGRMFGYMTTGVSISSVEVDVLTGDHQVLRCDVIMDIGNSLNYAIDIGQIEGGFIQGLGWCTTEETLIHTASGANMTRGPGTYKIPGSHDIPQQFNIKLLKDKQYKRLKTIKSSKAIGEPPLFLASSVFFALRDAVCSVRESNLNKEPLLNFPSPATSETLRLHFSDHLLKMSNVEPIKQNQKEEKLFFTRS